MYRYRRIDDRARYVNECMGIDELMTEVCEWMHGYIWMDDGGMWMNVRVNMNGCRRYVNESIGIYELMTEVCKWMH